MNEFDKIIGYASTKKELMQISDTLKNADEYAKLGVKAPNGLLLFGVPGVGKTLMANSLIAASGRKAFVCRKDKPNGDFIKSIKSTFDEAVKNAPSIVFLDDMDKFANGDSNHRDAEEYVTVQSCIDANKGKGVFVLATANSIDVLPRSLLRAGRFDRVIEVSEPRGEEAEKIVGHYLSEKTLGSDIDPKLVARIMDGRSCAELETIINEAGLIAGYERAGCITMDHFIRACLTSVFGTTNYAATDDDDDYYNIENGVDPESLKKQIILHEAGHAVVSEILSPGCVTLVCTRLDKGFTSYYRIENNPLTYKKNKIIGSLGGMAAIEQRLGITDCGASNDLDGAFYMMENIVTSVCEYGFGYHVPGLRESETRKEARENMVISEVERYYRKAKEIIAKNGEFYDAVVNELSKTGLITMNDIARIKANCKIVAVSAA